MAFVIAAEERRRFVDHQRGGLIRAQLMQRTAIVAHQRAAVAAHEQEAGVGSGGELIERVGIVAAFAAAIEFEGAERVDPAALTRSHDR